MFVVSNLGETGLSSGLTFLWSADIIARLLSFLKYHIDMEVEWTRVMQLFIITRLCDSFTNNRQLCWNMLRSLKARPALPWICGGDFNEILFRCEKCGGGDRSET